MSKKSGSPLIAAQRPPCGLCSVADAVTLALALALVACGGGDPAAGDDGTTVIDDDSGATVDVGVRDAGPTADAPVDPDVGPPPDAGVDGPQGIEINPGWIGGACASPTDCTDPNLSQPICQTDGFPGGYCTEACDGFCPDTDYSSATLNTISRCIAGEGGQGRCVSECDYDKSPTGCRPGYACVKRRRFNDPDSILSVCLPAVGDPWPAVGPPIPEAEIGEACIYDDECADSTCLRQQAGYCTKSPCTPGQPATCPPGSKCVDVLDNNYLQLSACLATCTLDAECRQADNYACAPDEVCRQRPRPAWDPSVGPADCATAWGQGGSGLSSCDAVKDTYVVVRKSARNLALCEAGQHVDSFDVGLGFSPIGDKVLVGDGKTPEGVFYVARLHPTSSNHLALVVSYPDKADAARGLADGLIDAAEKAAIDAAQDACLEPPSSGLGSLIEVHGGIGGVDWTQGCVGIANVDMDQVWAAMGLHDTIVIWP